MPIALDETASAIGALQKRVCQAVCLKIAGCGGITGVVDAARQARAAGYEVYLASTLDGPLGIAAALHVAAVVRPDRASGLATLALFADRKDPLPARDGRIEVPAGAGLGDGLHLLVSRRLTQRSCDRGHAWSASTAGTSVNQRNLRYVLKPEGSADDHVDQLSRRSHQEIQDES